VAAGAHLSFIPSIIKLYNFNHLSKNSQPHVSLGLTKVGITKLLHDISIQLSLNHEQQETHDKGVLHSQAEPFHDL
jgi:hypothetical protein